MTGMNQIPSKQPHASTYAEQGRVCVVCSKTFEVQRYNRHRTTCNPECSKVLMSQLGKERVRTNPEVMRAFIRAGHKPNYEAQFGDPRDETMLLDQLFELSYTPCPKCGGARWYRYGRKRDVTKGSNNRRLVACIDPDCKYQKSVKTGTIFQKNYTPLAVWMEAIRQVNGGETRAVQLSKHLGVTQTTAWRMVRIIRPLGAFHPIVQWAKNPERPVKRGILHVAT